MSAFESKPSLVKASKNYLTKTSPSINLVVLRSAFSALPPCGVNKPPLASKLALRA